MTNLIGIGHKKGVGKDTVADIIKLTTAGYNYIKNKSYSDKLFGYQGAGMALITEDTQWEIKGFADKLKDMVCLLIGCTREQLEDPEFKETPLGKEWWVIHKPYENIFIPYTSDDWASYGDFENNLVKTTPRQLLQQLGTEVGRQIHPSAWVNALFADYKEVWNDPDPIPDNDYTITYRHKGENETSLIQYNDGASEAEVYDHEISYPSWIISDVRFPDEAQAIKDRGGIVIKVDRPESSEAYNSRKIEWASDKAHYELMKKYCTNISEYPDEAPVYDDSILWEGENYKEKYQDEFNDLYDYYCSIYQEKEHESETALDNYQDWDWVIDNNGSIEGLVDQVETILKHFKIT